MNPRVYMNVRTIDEPYGTREIIHRTDEADANVRPLPPLPRPPPCRGASTDGMPSTSRLVTGCRGGDEVRAEVDVEDWCVLLKALDRANILEHGYVRASIRRKHTAVRKPDVRKPAATTDGAT